MREDTYDSYDEHYPPRRPREGGRRDRDGYKSEGYKSDKRPRDSYDDRDRRDRPRDDRDRRDRDRDRDRPRDSRRDDRYDGLFEKPRRDRYDDRGRKDRYDDDRYGDRSRSGGKSLGKSQPQWQKEALNMFKEYAVPIIKAEGGKFIAKQMAGGSKRR